MKRKSHTENIWFCLLMCTFCFIQAGFACVGNCPEGTCGLASVTFAIPRSTVTADTLVNLLKSGSDIALIECRRARQKTDLRIPGALVICDDVAVASLTDQLPARDRLLVIYPGLEGGDVAAMATAFRELGFQSILEYQDGIQGWLTYGYKVEGEGAP